MAGEIVGPSHSPRRINGVPDDPTWDCHCEDKDGDGFCDHCGAPVDEFDGHCENEPCWCPLDFNGAVALFMAFLACAYAFNKVRVRKSNEE